MRGKPSSKNCHNLAGRLFKKMLHSTNPSVPATSYQLTGLPTLNSLFPVIEKAMSNTGVGVLFLDIVNFTRIENLNGRDICNKILSNIALMLKEINIRFRGNRTKIGICSLGGDDFLLLIETPEHDQDYVSELMELKEYIEDQVNLVNSGLQLTERISIYLGYSEIKPRYGYQLDSLIYTAVKEASNAAKSHVMLQEQTRRQNFIRILSDRNIRVLYQPIISLKSGNVFGYEALSRGPVGTEFESPSKLFKAALNYNCLFELESICHEVAISGSSSLLGDCYLFLNVIPAVLNTTHHQKGIRFLLKEYGVDFNRVVLELTERTAIEDYAGFRQTLRYYRNQGFLIAIDDAGAGYSSLEAIAELQPEFVKIDMSLVRDIHTSSTKRAIMETFADFSYKINSKIICEGIEKEEELMTIANIGCDYGQGYLFASPGEMGLEPSPQSRKLVLFQKVCSVGRSISSGSSKKIGEIAMSFQTFDPGTVVREIVDVFRENKLLKGVAVCKDVLPIGLIMRERLFSMLGTRYGYDLFINRRISEVMDKNPLTLEWDTPIEEAACQVAEKLDVGASEYVIIVREQLYQGLVSVAKLLDTMAKTQIEQAKDANPLTGMPGNRCITEWLIKNLASGQEMAVLYLDLDNFKAFNDYYGFEHGDRALSLVAQIITNAVAENGDIVNDMVGHVGGDDFIVVCDPNRAEAICKKVIEVFDRRVVELYDQDALRKGYIVTINRHGKESRIPVMSISIAGILVADNNFSSHLQLGEVAAELKKKAKSQTGSCFLFEQRCSILKKEVQGITTEKVFTES